MCFSPQGLLSPRFSLMKPMLSIKSDLSRLTLAHRKVSRVPYDYPAIAGLRVSIASGEAVRDRPSMITRVFAHVDIVYGE